METKYRKPILYVFVGVLTTVVSWGTYALFAQWLNITLSNILSWICAVSFAYVLNKFLVFRSHQPSKGALCQEIITFFTSRLASGIIETIGLSLLSLTILGNELFGIKSFGAKILMSLFSMVFNYVLSNMLIFKTSR